MSRTQKVALITTSTGQDSFFLLRILKLHGYYVFGLSGGSGVSHIQFDTILPFSFLETHFVMKFLHTNEIHEIYNLAAKSSVADSWTQQELYKEVNFYAVKRLLLQLVKSTLKNRIKFLQVGSTDMLGLSYIDEPISPKSAWSPYGKTKLDAHFETLKAQDKGLFSSSIILTNHDSFVRPSRFVIPSLAMQIANVITKKSRSLCLANWSTTRDWAYAQDCVEAMYLTLQLEEPRVTLAATGVSKSLEELANFCRSQYHLDFDLFSCETKERPNDLERIYIDGSQSRQLLNWKPTKTGPDTLFSIIDHYLNRHNFGKN
jgi:GDPmannose 4,6-dehydratase